MYIYTYISGVCVCIYTGVHQELEREPTENGGSSHRNGKLGRLKLCQILDGEMRIEAKDAKDFWNRNHQKTKRRFLPKSGKSCPIQNGDKDVISNSPKRDIFCHEKVATNSQTLRCLP